MTGNENRETTTKPIPLLKADHVALRVPDFDAAIEWYQTYLDFDLMHRFKNGDLEIAFIAPKGSHGFRIELLSLPRQGADGRIAIAGWDHVCFSVENVEEMLLALRHRGLAIDRGPFVIQAISQKIAFFSDPWGNTFEITGPVE